MEPIRSEPEFLSPGLAGGCFEGSTAVSPSCKRCVAGSDAGVFKNNCFHLLSVCGVRSIPFRALEGSFFKREKIKASKTGLQHITFFWRKNALLHRAGGEGKKQEVWDKSVLPAITFFAIDLWVSAFLCFFFFSLSFP